MKRYTWAELEDIAHGVTHGHGRTARNTYTAVYRGRQLPHHCIFAAIGKRLRDTGTVIKRKHYSERGRRVRTTQFEEEILASIEDAPFSSTKAISRDASQRTEMLVLRKQKLHPYHLHTVQAPGTDDYSFRLQFARW
ncbi:hypothetical protein PR048_015746 [Dryococelus australis]|uniref:Uncharacterized protein n=1 Tax=Dryococelus australis TaxID=614101 RepID=A0ABQ9HHT1_9NEOP|nr:hypothetical protein PR048_015746 [Dryococelus australis]